MNWIRKTVICIALVIMASFAFEANGIPVQNTETQKSDTNFSMDYLDASDFIQPQSGYQFAANIKTSHPNLVKWFDYLQIVVPGQQVVKSVSNFANQFSNHSKKISLLLYPFHYFW